MFRTALCGAVAVCLCAWPVAAEPPRANAQKTLQQQVDQLVVQLGSPSAQQRLGAEVLLCSMGADGFPLIEAASRRPDLKPAVAGQLGEIVRREQPRYLARLCRQKARDATWRWNERTALAAYDRVGRKNPRWDDLARAAIKQFVAPGAAIPAREPLEKTIEAGCDDPLILYFESRSMSIAGGSDLNTLERLFRTAAESMLVSNYPASRKCLALKNYVTFVTDDANKSPAGPPGGRESLDRSGRFLGEIMKLWPAFVKEPGAPEEFLFDVGDMMIKTLWTKDDGPKPTFDALYPPVKETLPNSPFLHRFEGEFYLEYAWFARGHGYANTVTPQAWKLMEERLPLAEAALVKAWDLEPEDPSAAVGMMKVELSKGGDRNALEIWYQRAMKADPDNWQAAGEKMLYLQPKWHGSAEEMLAFGRELRDSKNHVARMGNQLIDAHVALSKYASNPEAYFQDRQVWDDIRSVFEPYLAATPEDAVLRSSYAFNACRCAQWAEAKRQFAMLGDKVSPKPFGGQAGLDRYRRLATTGAPGDAP